MATTLRALSINNRLIAPQVRQIVFTVLTLSGMPPKTQVGRYIKMEYKGKKGSGTIGPLCLNETAVIELPPESASCVLGDNVNTYYMCETIDGKKCDKVGNDNYVVSKTGSSYTSVPKYYSINVAQVVDKYPFCNPGPFQKIRR